MDDILKTAQKAALKAGEIMMAGLEHIEVSFKAYNNPVTQIDHQAEEAIINTIRESFPEHSFFCEESQIKDSVDADHVWIVDPLDGTNNYSRKIPHFCVSIAYAEKGDVKAGVIYDPIRKEMFTAIKGQGVFLNGKKVRSSDSSSIFQAVIATGFYYDQGELMEKTLKGIHELFKKKMTGIRRMGSAALDLAWVACGRYDGYFEYNLCPWDFAAGMLMVREAGGKCSDRNGCDMKLDSTGMIVSASPMHEEMIQILKWTNFDKGLF